LHHPYHQLNFDASSYKLQVEPPSLLLTNVK